MITLITGGAGSGKSAYAEGLAIAQSGGENLVYLATMQPHGAEAAARIAKHRALASRAQFTTLEHPRDLHNLQLPFAKATILLECLTNLAANQLYLANGSLNPKALPQILQGITTIANSAKNLVIVSGEVFADGLLYPPETLAYIQLLAACNKAVAAKADNIYEVVAGIPLPHKERTVPK